ncbi:copper amine oxidase N-terminal domain-containing protein [Paenibacillus sp. FSL R5-0810]|uniref:copper amine oxidase N-terminal domain-containing protein n=1 Tax=Paenibacillus sp. FSL R5-0810 TaxID=2921659 RepID=UPI0030FBED97
MKRIWTALLAAILIVPFLFQSQAQAAVNISVVIDGVRLKTPQAPVMIQGRVMLPMRVIFEALDASVKWNQKTKTVTAVKDGTTIVLKINSKTATINGKTVSLDVPAKNLKGNTMVPVRFVSESLGEKIGWNSRTKTVTITTSSEPDIGFTGVNHVTLRDIGNAGDGRDLSVSFSKSSTESQVSHYRVFIVKQSQSLSSAEAQRLPSTAYTSVLPTGSDLTRTLSASTTDTNGDLIRNNQPYKAYVLTVGNTSGNYALSPASPSLTLTNSNAVAAATNVKASDVSNYGDGRDLSVSFTRAQSESNISNYQVFVVKSKDAAKFDLAAAKAVASTNYTTVNKSSSSNTTLTTGFSSTSRDTSGEYIRSGVAYTVFVLSVSSNENAIASKLSSGSSSITLSTGTTTVPSISQVTDVSDYGDGRDLRVSFNRVSNESSISGYRIFVVKESDYHNFSVSRANAISSSSYYTNVSKSSNNTLTLGSGARDVDGALIRNGVYYRVFVMALDNQSQNNNVLSSASSSIILTNNSYRVGTISSLYVSDVGNYGNGRDLEISFNRASDESNISHYRVFVVKSSDYNYFDLSRAENNSYYTQVNKTGYNNYRLNLSSDSRDTDGALIRNGVSYRVYVMSYAYSGSNHALSSASSAITLSGNNQSVSPVSTPVVEDIGDNGNGSDLRVSFSRPSDEYYIDHYRVFVVKSSKSLSVNDATNNGYFTRVNKNSGYSVRLDSNARDTDGELIKNGTGYRVYVLSVGTYGVNAISPRSNEIKLQGKTQVGTATIRSVEDVGNKGDASDIKVKFDKATNETNIYGYRIMIVEAGDAQNFKLEQANAVQNQDRYDFVPVGNSFDNTLRPGTKDVNGKDIRNKVPYHVFVLSVSNDGGSTNALSQPYGPIVLEGTQVAVPSDVYAGIEGNNGNASDIKVRFTPADNAGTISEYRIMVVPDAKAFGEAEASLVKQGNYTPVAPPQGQYDSLLPAETKDVDGNPIKAGSSYRVYILVVADGTVSTKNKLSSSSQPFTIPSPTQVTDVKAELNGTGDKVKVSFKKAADERNIGEYRVFIVSKSEVSKFKVADAKNHVSGSIAVTGKDIAEELTTKIDDLKDAKGEAIKPDTEYVVFVLSAANDTKKPLSATATQAPALSAPSKAFVIKKTTATP